MSDLEKVLLDTALFMVIALLTVLVASLLFVFGLWYGREIIYII